jgi:hypothetical protein
MLIHVPPQDINMPSRKKLPGELSEGLSVRREERFREEDSPPLELSWL